MIMQTCPLCEAKTVSGYFSDKRRSYLNCRRCRLIFVPREQFLSEDEEKSRYDLHQNSPADEAYRQFLSRIFNPLLERLPAGAQGLDFGSGPGPTLSVMFAEAGYPMDIYDYYYAKNPETLEREYDFITATEVLEHLKNPRQELDRLWGCLKKGGNLGIMTQCPPVNLPFAKWRYKDDPTHICFFSAKTLQWLSDIWQAELNFFGKDAAIFYKKEQPQR